MKMLMGLVCVLLWAGSAGAAVDRTVAVAGSCTRSVSPDRASIIFTAEILDKDPAKAGQRASALYESLRKEVKKLALPDSELSSSEYSVEQVREYRKDRYVSTGNFKARMGLKVTTSDSGQLGRTIPLASKLQIQDIGSLTLSISPVKMEEEKAACLQSAAENAHMKADKLAASLGAKVGEVTSITEGEEDTGRPIPKVFAAKMSMNDASGNAPMIEAGRQDISVTVRATFSLK